MKQLPQPMQPSELELELSSLLNKHSRENQSDTPDYILATYLMSCLEAFETATAYRATWYGN